MFVLLLLDQTLLKCTQYVFQTALNSKYMQVCCEQIPRRALLPLLLQWLLNRLLLSPPRTRHTKKPRCKRQRQLPPPNISHRLLRPPILCLLLQPPIPRPQLLESTPLSHHQRCLPLSLRLLSRLLLQLHHQLCLHLSLNQIHP